MANDWIKFRDSLWTHPKFIGLSHYLAYNKDNTEFLAHIIGRNNLHVITSNEDSNEKVTEAALQSVTKATLRSVTMGALLNVWCAVNAHCKVDGLDAIMQPMSLFDLDDIAGFVGFGEALQDVGWVHEVPQDNVLIFHNFLSFNSPSVTRSEPLSNAERQARHRAKKKESNGEVTVVTKSNVEKRREEKKKKNNTSAQFDAWYEVYPRKVSKKAAWDKWKSLKLDDRGDELLDKIKQQVTDDRQFKGDPQYVPHPATYLNQRRWEDPIDRGGAEQGGSRLDQFKGGI